MKTRHLDYTIWVQFYTNVHNIAPEIFRSNTYQDWLNGTIKTDVDSLLDWRLRLKELTLDRLYKNDVELLNYEITAVDTILTHLYSDKKLQTND
jgi:hypothetical protein